MNLTDYEGTTHKTHYDHSDKKRTAEFLGQIQNMTNNDSNKSTRSIARNMGVSMFLIRQVVHKDIWYFLYKIKKV